MQVGGHEAFPLQGDVPPGGQVDCPDQQDSAAAARVWHCARSVVGRRTQDAAAGASKKMFARW